MNLEVLVAVATVLGTLAAIAGVLVALRQGKSARENARSDGSNKGKAGATVLATAASTLLFDHLYHHSDPDGLVHSSDPMPTPPTDALSLGDGAPDLAVSDIGTDGLGDVIASADELTAADALDATDGGGLFKRLIDFVSGAT